MIRNAYKEDAVILAKLAAQIWENHTILELKVDFYHMNLLQGLLYENTEEKLLDYVISDSNGIYYVYQKPLSKLPSDFASKEASQYLAAMEMLSG